MAKDLFEYFADLEKAYDRVPQDKLWMILQEYGIFGHWSVVVCQSFYCKPEVCVRISGKKQSHSM